MKKIALAALFALALLGLLALLRSNNPTDRAGLVKLYRENGERFARAAADGDFSSLERIPAVRQVRVYDTYVEPLGNGFYYYEEHF